MNVAFPNLDALSPFLGSGIDILVRLGSGQSIAIDSSILQTYLPGAARAAIRHGNRGTYNLAAFVQGSAAVHAGAVSARTLRRTTAALLDSLARNVGRSEAPALDLAALLEAALARDAARAAPAAPSAFPAAFARFVALAALAAAFHSPRIRAVLARFFAKFGGAIAAAERPRALLRWACVLLESDLPEADVVSCLREIVVGRPSFLAEVGRLAAAAGGDGGVVGVVRDNLREIAERMDGHPLGVRAGIDRGRSLLRRGSIARRYSLPPLVPLGDVRLARLPHGRRRMYARAPVRDLGYLARAAPKALVTRQNYHEHRLNMLERQADAVQDLVETGGYVSDGFVGRGDHFADDLDMWSDGVMSDVEFDSDFLFV